ncbi:uncharacterized protein V6R79_006678 [Siganus canaliculatus]
MNLLCSPSSDLSLDRVWSKLVASIPTGGSERVSGNYAESSSPQRDGGAGALVAFTRWSKNGPDLVLGWSRCTEPDVGHGDETWSRRSGRITFPKKDQTLNSVKLSRRSRRLVTLKSANTNMTFSQQTDSQSQRSISTRVCVVQVHVYYCDRGFSVQSLNVGQSGGRPLTSPVNLQQKQMTFDNLCR